MEGTQHGEIGKMTKPNASLRGLSVLLSIMLLSLPLAIAIQTVSIGTALSKAREHGCVKNCLYDDTTNGFKDLPGVLGCASPFDNLC